MPLYVMFLIRTGGGRENWGMTWLLVLWELLLPLLISSQVPFKEKDEDVERLIPSGKRVRKALITKLSPFK